MYCLMIKTIKNNRLKTMTAKAFEGFEEAYAAMREAIKGMALAKACVFDGRGNIKEMKKYFDYSIWSAKKEDYFEEWFPDFVKPMEYLKSLFLNEGEQTKPFTDKDADPMLTWRFRKDVFELFGDKEGPCNGIVPSIRTNLSAKDPNHCYLYIRDDFGNGAEEKDVNELYIDLVKAE